MEVECRVRKNGGNIRWMIKSSSFAMKTDWLQAKRYALTLLQWMEEAKLQTVDIAGNRIDGVVERSRPTVNGSNGDQDYV